MLVDPILAMWSDRLYEAALVVYLVALLVHAVEYVGARVRTPAAVGATTGAGEAGSVAVADPPADPPAEPETARVKRTRADRYGRMGVSLTVLGVAVHLGAIVFRGLAVERWPLGNMYEYISALCLLAAVAWLVVLRRTPALRPMGVFVLTPLVLLMFVAGTLLYAQAAPVVPALQSYWLIIHVSTITLASGLLLVPGVASMLYLVKRSGRLSALAEKLPSADRLDRLAYRTTVVGFLFYTFAVVAGAVWAEAAWSRFWGWDPKETVAFVAWVLYAAYLHARATSGWRHRPAAWINVAGFATIVFNLFFINLVVAGLHSYAGV